MRPKLYILSLLISILFIAGNINKYLYSQTGEKIKNDPKKTEKPKIKSPQSKTKKSGIIKLNIKKTIEYLLRNSYDVKKVLLEYRGMSSGLLMFQSKFDTYLFGSLGYSKMNTYNYFSGSSQENDIKNFAGGFSKSFSTGTTLKTSILGMHQGSEKFYLPSSPIALGGGYYQTNINFELAQELLKNCFGINDRMTEQKLANITNMGKKGIRMKLAGLIVDALIGYWNIAIAKESIITSEKSLQSTVKIRNIISRNMRLGLSEKEDILDWNGKVLANKNGLELAKKFLFDARLNVLRKLNLDSNLEIEIGKSFQTDPPGVKYEQALKDAFIRRVDWNNQKIAIKNSELEYKIASNMLLPSLKLKAGAGNNVFDKSHLETMKKLKSEYSVGMEVTYPLGNRGAEARMRDARLNLKKEEVNIKSLEKKIKDELVSLVNECEVNYRVYVQTKKSREYAQNYYRQVLKKFSRGRYNSLKLKFALDGYIMSRNSELKSLVGYNISLLRRDFARNVIFEKYDIDIDSILKRLEN